MYLDYSRLKADNSLNFVFLLYQYRTKGNGLDIWSFCRTFICIRQCNGTKVDEPNICLFAGLQQTLFVTFCRTIQSMTVQRNKSRWAGH